MSLTAAVHVSCGARMHAPATLHLKPDALSRLARMFAVLLHELQVTARGLIPYTAVLSCLVQCDNSCRTGIGHLLISSIPPENPTILRSCDLCTYIRSCDQRAIVGLSRTNPSSAVPRA